MPPAAVIVQPLEQFEVPPRRRLDAKIASQGQTTLPKKASQHADVSEPCSVTGFRRFPPRAARGGHRIAHSAAHHAEGGEVGAIESGEDLIVQEMSRKGSQALPQGRRAIPRLEPEHAAHSLARALDYAAHQIRRLGASIRLIDTRPARGEEWHDEICV